MKNTLIIVGGSVASFLVLLLVGVGLLYMKPDLFVQSPAGAKAVVDSVKANVNTPAKSAHDSSQVVSAAKTTEMNPQAKPDTLLVSQLTEKTRSLESIVDSLKRNNKVEKAKADSVAQPDWKTTAKLIEAMNAEEAGKILKQMSDSEVKQVITKVKKKQAGKILANLDPDRAARILR